MILRAMICIVALGFSLYSFIDTQNDLTQMRMSLPVLAKEVKSIQEENMRLQYEIDQFENPEHLMELARQSEYCHLKHPLNKEIVTMQQGVAMHIPTKDREDVVDVKPVDMLAIGAK
jgi:hypothetical protein